MSNFTETQERAAVSVSAPYRKSIAVVDKTYLAVNSALWKKSDQAGCLHAEIFTNLELTAPATDVDIEPWLRRLSPNSLKDPTGFLKTVNAEVGFTDYTSQVKDDNVATVADLSNLDTLANGDAVFIGYSEPFVGVSIEIKTTAKNSNASVMSAHYENGAGYQALTMKDFTKLAGASLDHDGEVLWDAPSDWVKSTKGGISAYWARLTFSAALDASVNIEECGVLLGYAYAGKLSSINLASAGRWVSKINIDGDDVAVLYRAVNGGGSALLDLDIGWH